MSQRDELFAYLLEQEGFRRHSDANIARRRNDEGPCRLSFSQERLWFLQQFERARPVYNGCKVVRFTGELNVQILQQCLNLIAQRHEILRTIYPVQDDVPIQRVLPAGSLQISLIERKDMAESEVSPTLECLIRDEWLRPIDLSQELPVRALLIRIHDTLNVLILTLHQIAFDSQSVTLFFRELWAAYAMKLRSKEPQLPALPVQYADFAEWQRDRSSSHGFRSQREYWIGRLSGPLPVTNLPTDKPRPPVQRFNGSRLWVQLPNALQLKLKQMSREHGVTLFTTLLTAFKILLYRYTAQEDLLVGCPVLNRGLPETENLLGSFFNTLVLRTNYAGNPSFRAALRRVRDACIGAFEHQEFPFEKLVEDLKLQRDLARNPIFQVMFAFQTTRPASLELPRLRSEFIESDGGMTKFDLTLSLNDHEHEIAGHIEYSTDLFDRPTIEQLVVHYQTLLESIVADSDRLISDFEILTKPERDQLLTEWNDTAADYPRDKCIHDLFEEQASRNPDAIAAEFDGQSLTYRELNRRANKLSHYLTDLGVGPEKLVGICIDRSPDMVVGLLATLKAGGAYVPLDPAYPQERLQFMLEDAGCAVVVTQEQYLRNGALMADSSRSRYVCLDRDWAVVEREAADNRHGQVTPDNLAYVIYTSGSTGQPRGVKVSHRSVVNCLVSIGRSVGLSSHDRLLAVTTISFDIAALEFFLPLLVGGTVILAGREDAMDGPALLRRLTKSSATVMQATPVTWRMLIEVGWEGSAAFKILCGGELLSRELAEALLKCGEVWNLYGPTETTIWSTLHKVEGGEGPVPIGRPIANTQIYILDAYLQPVPVGVHGDLYIGGEGLARGYLNQPELTAERFVPNPFSNESGSRLYRTGDRARYLADGNIEFLGRLDNQVKIRGHRIELAEIEAVLNQHAALKQCVVVARDEALSSSSSLQSDIENLKSLVAYIVPKESPAPSVAELRNYLRAKLPDYMIPSGFVQLDALPLTPNGKLDRNALPPVNAKRLLHQGSAEPRTEIEELVAQVWREVLKLDKIGIHDNFFELGGHSLLATRIVTRLGDSFKVDLPLRKLFELPTVAGLAAHIEILRGNEAAVCVPPILPRRRDGDIPLSFSQQRLWFLRQLDPDSTAYNMPSCFVIHGPLKIDVLERAINGVIVRHEILRTVFVEKYGNPVQVILPSLQVTVSAIDLSDTPEEYREARARDLALTEARRPFDLRAGPLLRAQVLIWGHDKYHLLLSVDHMISDGPSMAIFFKEISALYQAFVDCQTPPLDPLAVQFADYAVWQRESISAEFFNAELDYWKRQFHGWLPQAELVTDHARPSVQTWQGARLAKNLSRELTSRLKERSQREGVTLFMTLLAAFDIIVSRYAGSEDVVIGSTIAGRNRSEIENLIGFFINALPLRVDLSGNPSFTDLLKRVREVCLDAHMAQDLPFEKIVEAVNPQRKADRNPLFQVLFNIADTSERLFSLRDCEVSRAPLVDREAKFDITLYAPEKDGSVELVIVYNTDLFKAERIDVMLDQYAHLLEQVVEQPNGKICDYDLVTAQHKAILPDPVALLDNRWIGSICELFSRNRQKSPDKFALTDDRGSWTYAELEGASQRLADVLSANGIRPKDNVAIYANRGSSLVVSLLGALKAGGVFTIVDPAYPAKRLVRCIELVRPKAWIQLEGACDPEADILHCLDTLGVAFRLTLPDAKASLLDSLPQGAEAREGVRIGADDPAYIAFTSGSTGEPKAVLGRHGPMTHFLPWLERVCNLGEDDRFALLSGLAYNLLHRDVFTPLILGARLYVPSPEIAREPVALCEWLRSNLITVLHLTPALGRLLLTGRTTLPELRQIFFAGDVLTWGEASLLRELAPNATIGCFYGATETQRAVGYYEIPADSSVPARAANRPVPLGRGIDDVQLLVLNKNGKLAGVGELGELYVRSPHLAQGYVGDTNLTAQRFVTNPFNNNPEDRLYRTGELARYLPDGNVQWAGRNDRRVNIRGFRVELEEIETVLKQHPAVNAAAVVLRDAEAPGNHDWNSATRIIDSENSKSKIEKLTSDARLVAYIVSDEEASESLNDLLHSFLSSQLPDYMLPAEFVILNRLPLSPNGKIDYNALPPPMHIAMPEHGEPRTFTERELAKIFAEVLSREKIGIEDNFFRLGGHSLLAAQAAARIREVFGVALELRAFLESPVVAALAKQLELRLQPDTAIPIRGDTDRQEIEL